MSHYSEVGRGKVWPHLSHLNHHSINYFMERKDYSTKNKKTFQFDPLDITESLGYKTYRKNGRNSWSKEDDNELRTLMNCALVKLGFTNGTDDIKCIQESEKVCKRVPWEDIAEQFKNSSRKPKELKKRWTSSLDPNLKRGKWSSEEDEQLLKAYAKHGPHWLDVAEEILGRTEDQCAKRYVEILGPSSEGRLRNWTLEEDLSLVSKVKSYGTKWRRISSELESRPSLTCRNRWRKIITSVVRGQAPPEIVKAVKENRDIDSLINSMRNGVKDKGPSADEKPEECPDSKVKGVGSELPDATGFTDSGHDDLTLPMGSSNGVKVEVDTSKSVFAHPLPMPPAVSPSTGLDRDVGPAKFEEDSKSELRDMVFRDRLPNDSHLTRESTISYDVISRSSGDGKQTVATPKGLTPLAERMSNISPQIDRGSSPAHLGAHPSFSPVYSREPELHHSNSREQRIPGAAFNPLSNSPQVMSRSAVEGPGETEWKFTLKDGQGLSITSGSISNTDLVKELVEQAKKFSLKISLHQHIHHHYGGQADQNCINSNGQENMTNVRPNSIGPPGPGVGPPSGHEFFTSSHYYKASFGSVDNNSDFFAQEANYNIFGLEPSPQPDMSHIDGNATFPHSGQIAHQNHSPVGYSSRPNTTSPTTSHSTGNNDDLPEIASHRGSHFNYLPSTVRPQLGSSDSTRSTDISRLLNPSPGSSKKKRKRRRSLQSETSLNSGGKNSVKPSPSSNTSKGNRSVDSAAINSGLHDEEGLDFWESLRSLAGKPQEEEEIPHSHYPYGDEEYDILYSLFDDKAENVDLGSVENKEAIDRPVPDKDHIIPFNPS